MTFSWNAASDSETPTLALTYNLRVGTSPGTDDVMPAMADLTTGYRRAPAMGNVQQNTSWTVKSLEPGTYYWSVQAVDTAFAGGAWAAEQAVTVTGYTYKIADLTTGAVTDAAAVPDLVARVGSVRCKLSPVFTGHPMTSWARDRWLALGPAGGSARVTPLSPREEAGSANLPVEAAP